MLQIGIMSHTEVLQHQSDFFFLFLQNAAMTVREVVVLENIDLCVYQWTVLIFAICFPEFPWK